VVKKFAQEKLVDVLLHEVNEYVKDLNTEKRNT
jgi:hypothetical protein